MSTDELKLQGDSNADDFYKRKKGLLGDKNDLLPAGRPYHSPEKFQELN